MMPMIISRCYTSHVCRPCFLRSECSLIVPKSKCSRLQPAERPPPKRSLRRSSDFAPSFLLIGLPPFSRSFGRAIAAIGAPRSPRPSGDRAGPSRCFERLLGPVPAPVVAVPTAARSTGAEPTMQPAPLSAGDRRASILRQAEPALSLHS